MAVLHERELCLHGDDSTAFPFEAEQRLARKLGKARLIEYATASYTDLDKTRHWKR